MALIGLRAIDSTVNAIPGRRIRFVERDCFTRSPSASPSTLTNCLCVSAAAARKRVAKKKHPTARYRFYEPLTVDQPAREKILRNPRRGKNGLRADSFFYYGESFTHLSLARKYSVRIPCAYSYMALSPLLSTSCVFATCSGAPRRRVCMHSCLGLRQSRPVIGAC